MVEISLTPRPEMIDGNELLIDVEGFLSRFVVYPSEAARIAHVLWIGHAWFMEHWESTPRIAFLSPEPGSGKSRALEVTEPLVPRPVHAVNATPAYLFRKASTSPVRQLCCSMRSTRCLDRRRRTTKRFAECSTPATGGERWRAAA